ncbi:hypothetical protein FHR37_003857 [Actinopolymorpha cephalotaxi]|uniref:Uncharacterized protein n=1 Tax=Actinopolymorpha cephalotaxi TaxID=504797 RepID=A0ABX2S9Y6_9ACTN|nr:hypothetical protein [Actinopolymorpha cephalotaxi]NYH85006.1 hypothetical protein [Actinopolymorpha cephalotaxi]
MKTQVDARTRTGAGGDVTVVDVEHVRLHLDPRELPRQPAFAQCVVAERPSSSPVRASANTPVQIVASRAPRACAASSAERTGSDSGSSTGLHPGMIAVSADSSADRSCSTYIA